MVTPIENVNRCMAGEVEVRLWSGMWYGNMTGERSGCGVVWECDQRKVRWWSGMGI